MKKMLLVMAAAALVAGDRVQAQSETVTSVNVVGYYSVTIPANGAALVTPVLESFGSGNVTDLIGDQLPSGSTVFIWDRLSSGYISANKTRSGWAGAGATNLILRGDAVWLVPPKDGQARTVTFMGEAPGSYNLAATTTVHNISGADAVGYSYPTDIMWTNTSLAAQLPVGAVVFTWNLSTQEYQSFNKTRSGWGTGASLQIKAGQAFWVSTAVPLDWQEVVPYDL